MQTDTSPVHYCSFDARSEYPYIMCTKYYPMSRFALLDTGKGHRIEEIMSLVGKGYCVLCTMHIEGARCRDDVTVPYIPQSKCRDLTDAEYDNGRVLYASFLSITLTEIDLDIIARQYTWDRYTITDVYIADSGMLPEPIRGHVFDGFVGKCGYEERGEKDSLYYGKEKNKLNGNFGMMYTDPVRENIIYKNATGEIWESINPDVEGALKKFANSRNSFLWYQWGVDNSSRPPPPSEPDRCFWR